MNGRIYPQHSHTSFSISIAKQLNQSNTLVFRDLNWLNTPKFIKIQTLRQLTCYLLIRSDSSAHERANDATAAYGAYHSPPKKHGYLLDALGTEERTDIIDRGTFGD